jgi:hypothetical protein
MLGVKDWALQAALMLLLLSSNALLAAESFTPGDLLITDNTFLYEYTPSGALVQSMLIPFPSNPGDPEPNRDPIGIVADAQGNAYLSNYSATAGGNSYLSSYNSNTGTWSNFNLGTGQSPGNIANADVSLFEHYLFFGDHRFDISTQTLMNVPSSALPPIPTLSAFSVGENNVLYAVMGGSPQWEVRESDPLTYAYEGDLALFDSSHNRLDIRGLAATASGNLYVAAYDGTLYEFSPTGIILNQFTTGISNLITLAMQPNGQIVTSNRFGQVVVTNSDFSSSASFHLSNSDNTYTAFVPLPEPPGLALAGAAALTLLVGRWSLARKNRRH